jgi:hypothetical protein
MAEESKPGEVLVDLTEYEEGMPKGDGSWGFRFGPDSDEQAETLWYSDQYENAAARAAEDARQRGVQTIYLVATSSPN